MRTNGKWTLIWSRKRRRRKVLRLTAAAWIFLEFEETGARTTEDLRRKRGHYVRWGVGDSHGRRCLIWRAEVLVHKVVNFQFGVHRLAPRLIAALCRVAGDDARQERRRPGERGESRRVNAMDSLTAEEGDFQRSFCATAADDRRAGKAAGGTVAGPSSDTTPDLSLFRLRKV
jgi:hypothetical protein